MKPTNGIVATGAPVGGADVVLIWKRERSMNEYVAWGLLGALLGGVLCGGAFVAWIVVRWKWSGR